MPFDENSPIGDIIKDEQAKAVLEKHLPGFTTDPRLQLRMSMKLMVKFPQAKALKDKLPAILEDLSKLP
jgi:hypothetical protein